MSPIPDPIERGESRCESWLDEAEQPDGRVKCDCGKLFNLDEGETLSPDPYAIPVCSSCAEDYFKNQPELNLS